MVIISYHKFRSAFTIQLLYLSLTFESPKSVILTYLQKLIWFIYLLSKIVYWEKFEGKLFPDAKCPGPLLQRSPLNHPREISISSQKISR